MTDTLRERAAELVDYLESQHCVHPEDVEKTKPIIEQALRDERAAERERAAKIADAQADEPDSPYPSDTAKRIAAAIRKDTNHD